MESATEQSDPVAAFVRHYCPDLPETERQNAENNLRRYLAVVARIADRLERENREDSLTNERGA